MLSGHNHVVDDEHFNFFDLELRSSSEIVLQHTKLCNAVKEYANRKPRMQSDNAALRKFQKIILQRQEFLSGFLSSMDEDPSRVLTTADSMALTRLENLGGPLEEALELAQDDSQFSILEEHWVQSGDLRPTDARVLGDLLTHYDWIVALGMAFHRSLVLITGVDPSLYKHRFDDAVFNSTVPRPVPDIQKKIFGKRVQQQFEDPLQRKGFQQNSLALPSPLPSLGYMPRCVPVPWDRDRRRLSRGKRGVVGPLGAQFVIHDPSSNLETWCIPLLKELAKTARLDELLILYHMTFDPDGIVDHEEQSEDRVAREANRAPQVETLRKALCRDVINRLGAHAVTSGPNFIHGYRFVSVKEEDDLLRSYSAREAEAHRVGNEILRTERLPRTARSAKVDVDFFEKTTIPKSTSSRTLIHCIRHFLKLSDIVPRASAGAIDPDAVDPEEDYFSNLLHLACRVDHPELANMWLAEYGACPLRKLRVSRHTCEVLGSGNDYFKGPAMASAIMGNSLRSVSLLKQHLLQVHREQLAQVGEDSVSKQKAMSNFALGMYHAERIQLAGFLKYYGLLDLFIDLIEGDEEEELSIRTNVELGKSTQFQRHRNLEHYVRIRNKMIIDRQSDATNGGDSESSGRARQHRLVKDLLKYFPEPTKLPAPGKKKETGCSVM